MSEYYAQLRHIIHDGEQILANFWKSRWGPEISYRQAVAEFMPDFLYTAMGIPAGTHVGRRIDVRWDAPASMLLLAGAVATGLSNRGPSSFASFLPREVMLPAVKLIS